MRTLLLTADYPPRAWSGIGTAVATQARALAHIGAGVRVLSPSGVTAGAPRSPRAAGDPVVTPLSHARFGVDPGGFDVVHLHSLALAELALQVRQRFGAPLVYTAHSLLHLELGSISRQSDRARTWRGLQAAVLAASDHVVLVSTAERTAVLARLPWLEQRCSVVPNGAPAALRRPAAHCGDGPVVFAGRFTRAKGIALLRDIVERLAPRGIPFVLAGGHGDDEGERMVDELVRRFPQRCVAVGWLDRRALDGLLSRAGLVVVPSEYEPFGMVALEAMRVGAPVLAADVGGLSDTVGPGSGGRLVASRDPLVWSEAVASLYAQPSLRATLAARGPGYVAARYDPVRMARRLVDEVYEPAIRRVIAGRAAS